MNTKTPEGLSPVPAEVKASAHDVAGFIPGISSLGPEALARLAAAIAEESATEPYNSAETLTKVIEAKEAARRQ